VSSLSFLFFSFFCFFFLFYQAREAAKSGTILFHEAMEQFRSYELQKSFERFERASAKGHEESIWILSVVKDVEMDKSALTEAFVKTEEPLGRYFAGRFSWYGREQLDFYKKSAEGGCGWGQVPYGWYFKDGDFVDYDEEVYLEWLEKAANQNNPCAMYYLGDLFRNEEGGDDNEKALRYFSDAAELGWKIAFDSLVEMLRDGEGCVKDLRQAAIWSAKGHQIDIFCDLLRDCRECIRTGEDLDFDLNQRCYTLGWGAYWYMYGNEAVDSQLDFEGKTFCGHGIDFYCSCVELQQESIFTFLLCWNQTVGVKGPGQMIAQMVWEGREDNLLKAFDEGGGEEPETKRIKK
jgi:hypothetical protein